MGKKRLEINKPLTEYEKALVEYRLGKHYQQEIGETFYCSQSAVSASAIDLERAFSTLLIDNVETYVQEGMSHMEAKKKVLLEVASSILPDTLSDFEKIVYLRFVVVKRIGGPFAKECNKVLSSFVKLE